MTTLVVRSLPELGRYPLVGRLLLVLLLATSVPALAQQPPNLPPAEVTVVPVKSQDTPANFEFTGQTESSRQVEIRSRVTGYLDKIAYQEGAVVHQGELLFQIDPRPFQASLDNAKGVLASQQATLNNARATLARVKPLAKQNAVSQKDLDDATAAVLTAQAAVQSAKAQVQDAEINLGYTTIRSPLTGLAGRSEKREGSLVTTGQDSLLTTVVQLDPMWVNFSAGENDVLKFRAEKASGKLKANEEKAEVELVLADGSTYPYQGRINYVAPTIDQKTGTLALRAEMPNPEGRLSPGLFVRVRVKGAVRTDVIMVPQRAVMQGPQGKFVYVVDEDNKAEVKPVSVGDFYGEQWIITSGLSDGDQVVVDGVIKVRPGAPVKIVTPAAASTPAGQQ